MQSLKRWKWAGIIFIILAGCIMHFLYAWTGENKLIGFFVPVNESVWEHLKMGYLAIVLFSVAEFLQLRHAVHNFFPAKVISVLALEGTILFVYYTYTSILGYGIVWVDIMSYVAGAFLGQYLVHRIFNMQPFGTALQTLSIAILVAIGVLFARFTYDPPDGEIFKDDSDTYTIHTHK